jgi:hypothetical protein
MKFKFMKGKKLSNAAKTFLLLLIVAIFLWLTLAVKLAMADRITHPVTTTTINNHYNSSQKLSGSLKGVTMGLACSNIHFIPSQSLQAGASLASSSDAMGLCVGGAFTTAKDGALVSGKLAKEEDETAWSVGASWRFK